MLKIENFFAPFYFLERVKITKQLERTEIIVGI